MGAGDVILRVGFSAAACVGVGGAGTLAMGGPWGFVLGCATGIALVNGDSTKPGCGGAASPTPPDGGMCGGDMGCKPEDAAKPGDSGDLYIPADLVLTQDAGRMRKRGVNAKLLTAIGRSESDIKDFYISPDREIVGVLGESDGGRVFVSKRLPGDVAGVLAFEETVQSFRNRAVGVFPGVKENGRTLEQVPGQIVPIMVNGNPRWAIPLGGKSADIMKRLGGVAIVSADQNAPLADENIMTTSLYNFTVKGQTYHSTAISSVVASGARLCFAGVDRDKSQGMVWECSVNNKGGIDQANSCSAPVYTDSTGQATTHRDLGNSRYLILNHGDSKRGINASLQVVDWSNKRIGLPVDLGVPGAVPLPEIPVSADGKRAVIGFENGKVKIVDINNPNNLIVSGAAADVQAVPRGIAVFKNNTAWVSVNNNPSGGLKMIDFSRDFHKPAVDPNWEVKDIANELDFCKPVAVDTLGKPEELILCVADVDGQKKSGGETLLNDVIGVSPTCVKYHDGLPSTLCPGK